jgi:hypothetical protein
VIGSLMGAELNTQTKDQRLMPARDPRRISVSDILDSVRNADRDPHHLPGSDWNATVHALTEHVETAIRDALGARSLADMVEQDVRNEAAPASVDDAAETPDASATDEAHAAVPAVPPHTGPRIISRR